MYIGTGAKNGSYTQECDLNEIYHSIHFPLCQVEYFFLEFGNDRHLITGLASLDFGEGVFVVEVVIAHEN